MQLAFILLVLLIISELLPFLGYISPKLQKFNSINALLFYTVLGIYNIVSCRTYNEYKKNQSDKKDRQLKRIISEVLLEDQSTIEKKIDSIEKRVEIISGIVA